MIVQLLRNIATLSIVSSFLIGSRIVTTDRTQKVTLFGNIL
jgi:hypothetical protein